MECLLPWVFWVFSFGGIFMSCWRIFILTSASPEPLLSLFKSREAWERDPGYKRQRVQAGVLTSAQPVVP